MTFTLALLGTDTTYTPTPNDKQRAYFGETLSVIAASIAQEETLTVKEGTNTAHGSVASVIQGPDTLGKEVGDRIARAILEILEHVVQSDFKDTDIRIIAHSRGAVEAILVAHELERIIKLFQSGTLLTVEELCHSPDGADRWIGQTHSIYYAMNNSPLKESFEAIFQSIQQTSQEKKEQLQHITVDMLNIDPVPGGNSVFGCLFTTRWTDPRFYVIPSLVRSYEQYVYLHENSRSFKSIIPAPISANTQFHLYTLPGHHGTGSGNLYDHDASDNSKTNLGEKEQARKITGHVQELLILKIVEFLRSRNSGVQFKEQSVLQSQGIDLRIAQLICFNTEESRIVQQQSYENMLHHMNKYAAFYDSNYAGSLPAPMVRENGWNVFVGREVVKDRLVHHKQHTDSLLATVIPPVDGYVNQDHCNLQSMDAMRKLFDFSVDDSATIKLLKMLDKILICFQVADQAQPDPNESFVLVDLVDDQTEISDLQSLQKLDSWVKRVFTEVMHQVIELYLAGSFSQDFKQKLLEKITNSVEVLTEHSSSRFETVELAKSLLIAIRSGLERAVTLRSEQLRQESTHIMETLQQSPTTIGEALLGNLRYWVDVLHNMSQADQHNMHGGILDFLQAQIAILEILKYEGWAQNDLKNFVKQLVGYENSAYRNLEGLLTKDGQAYHNNVVQILADKFSETYEKIRRYEFQEENIREAWTHCHDLTSYQAMLPQMQLLLSKEYTNAALQLPCDAMTNTIMQQLAGYICTNRISRASCVKMLNQSVESSLFQTLELSIQGLAQQAQGWVNGWDNSFINRISEQQTRIEELEAEKTNLQTQNANLQQIIETQKREILQLHAHMEAKAFAVIETLKKLTTTYQDHLNKAMQSAIGDAKQNIENKQASIRQLKECLDKTQNATADLENPCKNQTILQDFYVRLDQVNQDLGAHRDASWKRYVSNTVKVLGIVLTGILPGLAILGIFSVATGHSMRFWQSHGTRFIEKARTWAPEQVADQQPAQAI